MKLDSANLLIQELMNLYKIPSGIAGANILPSEELTRSVILGTKIPLAKGTVEVSIKEIKDSINPLTGLFELNGFIGAVYLHTTFNSGWDVDGLAKWHVTLCQTLYKQMNLGRLHEKYALRTAEAMSNDFDLTMVGSGQKIKRELRPCKNCLTILSQKSKSYRDAYSYKFTKYAEEFSSNSDQLLDLKGFKKDPKPNIYNADFKEKANAFKKLDAACHCCHGKFDLNYLEVHHKNRLKYDDRPENWDVLCVTCHIQEHRSDNPRMMALYTSNNRLADFFNKYPHKRFNLT